MIKSSVNILLLFLFVFFSCNQVKTNTNNVQLLTIKKIEALRDTTYNKMDTDILNSYFENQIKNSDEVLVLTLRVRNVCQSCLSVNDDSLFKLISYINYPNELYIITDDTVRVKRKIKSPINKIVYFQDTVKNLERHGIYSVLPYFFILRDKNIVRSWFILR